MPCVRRTLDLIGLAIGLTALGDELATPPSAASKAAMPDPLEDPIFQSDSNFPQQNGGSSEGPKFGENSKFSQQNGTLEGPSSQGNSNFFSNFSQVELGLASVGSSANTYSYSQADAVELAYLATATYCRNLAGWNCGLACQGASVADFVDYEDRSTGLRAVVGRRNDNTCFVAFRGTSNIAGVRADILAVVLRPKSSCSYEGRPCMVSASFQNHYDKAAPRIKEALNNLGCSGREVDITGHSLGGAMATLAAWDFAVSGINLRHTYTFGAPRQGNSDFAEAVRQVVTIMRVTRADDPIVLVPRLKDGFAHTGVEVYYAGAVSQGYRLCYGEDKSCAVSNVGDFAANLLGCTVDGSGSLCGHSKYMNEVKSGLMSSGSCTNNNAVAAAEQDILFP
mmetsp:Transcript_99344/g.206941  ORF Transcript_99344/g.206941 Transcript_99344/m.206941 type:complete len:395 (+) Transcript_99344:60-1244(+)